MISKRCVRAREHVSLDLDGELSEFERVLLAAHLAQCERCRRFEADVVAVTGRLRAAPLEALPQPVSLPRRRRVFATRSIQSAAAAAVLAVGFGVALSLAESVGPESAAGPRFGVGVEPGYNDRLIRAVRVRDMRPTPLRPSPGVKFGPVI